MRETFPYQEFRRMVATGVCSEARAQECLADWERIGRAGGLRRSMTVREWFRLQRKTECDHPGPVPTVFWIFRTDDPYAPYRIERLASATSVYEYLNDLHALDPFKHQARLVVALDVPVMNIIGMVPATSADTRQLPIGDLLGMPTRGIQ